MTILDTIVAHKRTEVARLEGRTFSRASLESAVARRGGVRDFTGALRRPRAGSMGLIAEVKKASPSAGVICPDFDPTRIAKNYDEAGASCLSVLTDERFFQGSLEYLRAIREHVSLPLLRKDFIFDFRQIEESVEWGADAILLIVAILTDDQLREYREAAESAGLAVLVEAHDETELDRALAAGATLIGVNNRDLRTFKVDLGTTERLAARLFQSRRREEVLLVGESGIHRRADVERLERAGAGALLVGESLMRDGDVRGKVLELLGVTSGAA